MDEKEFDYINVIPFIDIMLVLLTIVLTTSTFIARGAIPLELPKVTHQKAGALKAVSIEIDRQGAIYLNARPVILNELAREVRSFSPDMPILIHADRALALQVFVDVMDVIRSTGFKKISLRTEVKK
ncbi:MAG: biopolymer transporter ExbD [Deltaproteobacteria bacterium]